MILASLACFLASKPRIAEHQFLLPWRSIPNTVAMDAATDPASIEHWLNEASLQIHIPNLDKSHCKAQNEILTTSQREFAFYGNIRYPLKEFIKFIGWC